MRRALSAAVSASLHEPLDREETPEVSELPRVAIGREIATAVGTVVHAFLESAALDRHLRTQLRQARPRLDELVVARLEPSTWPAARQRLAGVLDALEGGRLLDRLGELADHVISRELPLLMPAAEDDGPLLFLSGRVDLVYQDPASGQLVTADFKTDRVRDDDELASRVAMYAEQVLTYARGVAEALQLEQPVRAELWFLEADRIEIVSPPPGQG
jgi:ATP-dependent exoDNAse (exonuclease V) beta subunit